MFFQSLNISLARSAHFAAQHTSLLNHLRLRSALCVCALQQCATTKKPMSIPSKTRKDQKAHEHSSNPCQKVLKPMSIASKTQKIKPRPEQEMLEWRPPALTNTPLSHAHTASPRPLARTHDTNTKRNRNRFPGYGQLSRLFSSTSDISGRRLQQATSRQHMKPQHGMDQPAPTQTTKAQTQTGMIQGGPAKHQHGLA